MGTIRPRTLAELFTAFWRRKMVIIVVAGVGVAATWPVIGWLPGLYESRALVMVSNPAREDAQAALKTQVANITQQLTSRPRLEPLIRRRQLQRAGESEEAAVERFRKEVKLGTQLRSYYPNAPESISVAWRHQDPQLAQQVVADIVASLNEVSREVKKEAISEAQRLRLEMGEVEGQLRQLGRQRAAANVSHNASAAQPVNRASLLSAIESLNDKQYALEKQITEQQRQFFEQQKLVAEKERLAKSTPTQSNSSYGALLVRKVELEAQLKDYSTQYTDKHPRVIQARSQLAEINRQLALLENSNQSLQSLAASPEATELRTMQRELIRLQTELDLTRRDLERKKQQLEGLPTDRPSGDAGAASAQLAGEADTDYDLLMKHYSGLQEKLAMLQLQTDLGLGAETALFLVVEPPNLPVAPVAPNRNLLRLLALGLALGLGVVLALGLEARYLLFIHDERDVNYLLGVPVIGLIPETLTPAERTQRWRLSLRSRLLWGGLAVACVPLLILLLTRLQLFQLIANR